MRILITGMEGFAGSHLAELGLHEGAEVHGTAFPTAPRKNLAQARGVHVHPLDLTEREPIRKLVQRLRPDVVTEIDHRADFQAIAPETEAGLYLVPRVVE